MEFSQNKINTLQPFAISSQSIMLQSNQPSVIKEFTMSAGERRIKIFNILVEKKTVEVSDLAKLFAVSAMTIRRDLAVLEKQGVVTTRYGGAALNEGTAIEPGYLFKASQMVAAKEKIGRAASGLVQDGDSIFIDCGTTAVQIAKSLQAKNLTVMTNSLAASNLLIVNSRVKLIMAPGIYDEKSAGFIGSMTVEFLQKYNLDKAFVAAQGFDLLRGATVPNEVDAQVKKAICACARQRVLLVDHEKLGASYLAKFMDPGDIDLLITDDEADPAYLQEIQAQGIRTLLAGTEP
jgi:DeoR/GlpR family transcriptional regulator of sugar metabolism